jgi:hypothetical protein
MPSLLMHLIAVERLGIDGSHLPADIARALVEDVEYARLGAALPDLPLFAGVQGALASVKLVAPNHFARLFHERAPATLAFKMAELVSNGALVGREPGLAFVAGYVMHVCLDRVLEPVLSTLSVRHRRPGEEAWHANARIAGAQALWLQRDFYGQDLVGDAALRSRLQMVKRPGLARGMGRGLYELLRVSCQSAFGEAPRKSEVDAWVRGISLYGRLLSSPWGRVWAARLAQGPARKELYRGDAVDVPAAIDQALKEARAVLALVHRLTVRGRFSERARTLFLETLPDAPLTACAA